MSPRNARAASPYQRVLTYHTPQTDSRRQKCCPLATFQSQIAYLNTPLAPRAAVLGN
ncbi:hypothetical protein [Bythopirellula polymerisocia]|uniref:Uncharacterized protein n=1 Tax=Bythopirellula polymerisocia TaxID=2528003 RepID=A0A5C6CEX6_9BACT|nr:hypothetical protein [Bythopirellula polymerisocia]TWU21856.1 hypothetical protein Pla144_45530 [Bythopirellula polymerisocia]